MPIRKVQTQTGIIEVDVPQGATDSQILQQASHQQSFQPSKPTYTTGEQWSRGLDRGMSRLGSTYSDLLPGVIASIFGYDEYALRQIKEAEEKEKLLQQKAPPQYASTKDVKS